MESDRTAGPAECEENQPSSAECLSSAGYTPDNMPASHAGDHRSEAGQGRQFSARGSRGIADPPYLNAECRIENAERLERRPEVLRSAPCVLGSAFESALKAFSAMRLLGKQASLVQFRVRAPFP